MMEDKEKGIKIAENEEEALWERVRKQAEKAIKDAKSEIKINEELRKAANKKLRSLGQKNK